MLQVDIFIHRGIAGQRAAQMHDDAVAILLAEIRVFQVFLQAVDNKVAALRRQVFNGDTFLRAGSCRQNKQQCDDKKVKITHGYASGCGM